MLIDQVVLGLVVLALALGVFLGGRAQVGSLLGVAAGYIVAALIFPRWGVSLSEPLGLPPLQILLLETFVVLAGLGLAGWAGVSAVLHRVPLLQRPLPVLDALVGAVSWVGCAVIAVAATMGALSLDEADALTAAERLSLSLRDSKAYLLADRVGLVQSQVSPEEMLAKSAAGKAAPERARVDYEGMKEAMKNDPRLREAMKDPVVRRAMETGAFEEVEERNRLLRPVGQRSASGAPQQAPVAPKPKGPRTTITADMVPDGFTLQDFKGE